MKLDLEDLRRRIDRLDRALYSSERDRNELGSRLIEAAPILLEAFSILAHAISIGEVVLPTSLDGTPASERLREALRAAAEAKCKHGEAPIEYHRIPVQRGSSGFTVLASSDPDAPVTEVDLAVLLRGGR